MGRKNIFFICMVAVIYLVSGVWFAGNFWKEQRKQLITESGDYNEIAKEDLGNTEMEEGEELQTALKKEEAEVSEIQKNEEESGILNVTVLDGEETDNENTVSANIWQEEKVEKAYFEDALFIGDSRTVGLKEYGDLKGAVFFADTGMSVFELRKKKLAVFDHRMESFEEVLAKRKYGKIYLMLGINELGYSLESIQKKYGETLEKIKEVQKDAIIYLCANLHITQEHSGKDNIYNNENVNRVNEMINGFADNKKMFYLDVNELFDDENGSLSTKYSSDSFHVYGKYYMDWVEWLCTKTVKTRKIEVQ